jgi:cephalosporin hydroxylase
MADNVCVAVNLPASEIITASHRLYYQSLAWDSNTFLGYQIKQCPFDLQIYQELVTRLRPKYIIQTGVAGGGSVLFLATLLDLCSAGPDAVVVGIDVQLSAAARSLNHHRVRLVEGSSTDPLTIRVVESHLPRGGGLVALDSEHIEHHVARELRMYSEYVAIGSYLVAEDTNLNGHPVFPSFGPGPFEAVEGFLREDVRFVRDDLWKRHLFSFHQDGWLKRVS